MTRKRITGTITLDLGTGADPQRPDLRPIDRAMRSAIGGAAPEAAGAGIGRTHSCQSEKGGDQVPLPLPTFRHMAEAEFDCSPDNSKCGPRRAGNACRPPGFLPEDEAEQRNVKTVTW
jgi:hypothetical protein